MRQRTDDAAAAAARPRRPHRRPSTSTSSARRPRPSVFCARSPARRRFRRSTPPRPARARRSTPRWPSSAAREPAGSEPATFLLDEFLELRTFESFPGLRRVLHDLVDGLAGSGNRFVLTSRYTARALRLLRDRSARFEVIHMPALTAEDTLDILGLTARPSGVRRTHTRLNTRRAPFRRSPTAGRRTCARSPTN